MTAWPVWDSVATFDPAVSQFAIDDATGRRAYRGPDAEPGTPDQGAADQAWGVGNYSAWTQPDGTYVFYKSLYGFEESLLAILGAPLDSFMLSGLSMWAQSEGMPSNSYNPLATMRTGYGEHYQPPFTAPFYPHPYAGLRATYDTLIQNAYGYPDIVRALRLHLGLSGLFDAINSSAWCQGCQGGHYPNVLYNAIKSGTGQPPAGNTGGQPAPGSGSGPGPGSITGLSDAWQEIKQAFEGTIPAQVGRLNTVAQRSPSG